MKIEIDTDDIGYILIGAFFILIVLCVTFGVRTSYIDKMEHQLFEATNTISIKR